MKLEDRLDDAIERARGLPTWAYTSEELALLERESLFARSWHAVGFCHDLPEAGDVFPVLSPAGRALLLVRDETNVVRVFHNFCRHRGMRLVDAPAKSRRNIVCPYHAWSYALDGSLLRIPHRHGLGKHAECPTDVSGLAPVRTALWTDIVFVDLSGQAALFDEYISPLRKRWSHYDLDLLRSGADMKFDVAGNWKLVIENFIDIYHVPYVHPSLNQYNNMTDHYFIDSGVVVGEGNNAYYPSDAGAGKLPAFPNLTPAQQSTIEAVCLFPNLLLTVFSDNLRVILVAPTGAASCHERVEIFFVGDASLGDELVQYREVVVERLPSFNREDVAIVSRLQKGFETSGFERAHFSAFFDGSVHRFQQMVARACG